MQNLTQQHNNCQGVKKWSSHLPLEISYSKQYCNKLAQHYLTISLLLRNYAQSSNTRFALPPAFQAFTQQFYSVHTYSLCDTANRFFAAVIFKGKNFELLQRCTQPVWIVRVENRSWLVAREWKWRELRDFSPVLFKTSRANTNWPFNSLYQPKWMRNTPLDFFRSFTKYKYLFIPPSRIIIQK